MNEALPTTSSRAEDGLRVDELLPRVYDELRQLANARLSQETPSHTLQPTALVHEAYLRLLPTEKFENRGHFFAAAAEAMRRIVIEHARGKQRQKRGGDAARVELEANLAVTQAGPDRLVEIDEVLSQLEQRDPQAALLVKLRFFVGLEHQEAAEAMGLTRRAADRLWLLARTWLYRRLDTAGR